MHGLGKLDKVPLTLSPELSAWKSTTPYVLPVRDCATTARQCFLPAQMTDFLLDAPRRLSAIANLSLSAVINTVLTSISRKSSTKR